MGQILNRIFKIAKSYLNSDSDLTSANRTIGNEDEDLKRIIDELNQENKKQDYQSSKNQQSTQSRDEMTIDNAYFILGLKNNASIDEIKSAYKQKVKDYHPDRVANLGEDLKNLAAKKILEINKAYEILKKYRGFN